MKIICKDSFFTYPILTALQNLGITPEIFTENSDDLFLNETTVIIGSPSDFLAARELQSCSIISQLGTETSGFAGISKIIFNSGLKEIQTTTFRKRDNYEKIIAEIILNEKYDSDSEFNQVINQTTLEQMLSKSNAALAVADVEMDNYKNFIDITDEWEDITETPLVHAVCYALNNELLEEKKQELNNLCQQVQAYISNSQATQANIKFSLNEHSLAGLDNFFKFAFYYGQITDLPQSAGLAIL